MYVYVITLRYSINDLDPLVRVSASPETAYKIAKDWLFNYFSLDDNFKDLLKDLDETYLDDKERFWGGDIVDVSKTYVIK